MLQRWRIAKARPFILPGSRVLDIGSVDGVLFEQLSLTNTQSLGIDPTLKQDVTLGQARLIAGFFPGSMPAVEPFDAITMLAVLEHFPEAEYESLARGCAQYLRKGGHLIITVPSAAVDHILAILKFLRLIDGMSLEEHHGFEVNQTPAIFSGNNFRLVRQTTFQLGLNHLFVFERV
jgi:2-polyprenyl-3-methyl-5-hydroxy-6-metoxy-1,4-benzoquinol methylase